MVDEATSERALRIIRLEAENVKRLRAVRIEPRGNMVVIGGKNDQGKSSTLDAIEMALGGKEAIPAEPIRHGARSARILLDLDELVVERVFTAKGGTQLEVRNKAGVPQRSPQTLLDKLCSAISFDPLEFARMKPAEQDKLLKGILGLDFTDLDAKRTELEGRRRETNAEIKRKRAQLELQPEHAGVPAEEVSIAELTAELERRQDAALEKARLARRVEEAEFALRRRHDQIADAEARVARMETELAQARSLAAALRADLPDFTGALDSDRAAAEAHQCPDPAEITAQLATVEETNRKVRANKERELLEVQIDNLCDEGEAIGSALDEIKEQKAAALAAAKFPVPGLGFDECGPTLNGVPLEQASDSSRLLLSAAIGAALHPQLRVLLIREGAFLDEDRMQQLAAFAAERDLQLWIERVGERDASAIIIEDGAVRESGEAAAE